MELRHQERLEAGRRWFLRAQGRTLGPLAAEEVRDGLRTGAVLPSDKVMSAQDKAWTPIEEHALFGSLAECFRPSADELVSPPSPRRLRIRSVDSKPTELPVLPVESGPLSSLLADFPTEPEIVAVAEEIPPAVKVPPQAAEPSAPARLSAADADLLEERAPESILDSEKVEFHTIQEAPAPGLKPGRAEAEPLWNPYRFEPETVAPPSTASPGARPPARPEYKPVFLADPVSWGAMPEPATATAPKTAPRTIQLQLRIPERAGWRALLALALVAALAYFAGSWKAENKTRDLKDFRLPDPSSPTTAPLEAGDPNPPLKAPTRPQRE